MKCYFDNTDAQGQCQSCGRFICREHSKILKKKLICSGCLVDLQQQYEESQLQYQQAQKLLIELSASLESSCGICHKPLIPIAQYGMRNEILNRFSLFSSDDVRRLEQEIPFTGSYCSQCKCRFCPEHKPQKEFINSSTNRYECRACGHVWKKYG